MASVHIANYVDMAYMFNITSGVGRGRANQRLDVMLIQYLLSQAMNEQASGSTTTWNHILPPDLVGGLNQDGICGDKTQRAIDFYQAFRNGHSTRSDANRMDIQFKVAQDGAIDPWRFPVAMNFGFTTSQLSRTDTLVTLCYDAAKSRDFVSMNFSQMHPDLRRLLCAH